MSLDAIKINHEHHKEYDEYGDYSGSEIGDMNETVIEAMEEYINHLENSNQ